MRSFKLALASVVAIGLAAPAFAVDTAPVTPAPKTVGKAVEKTAERPAEATTPITIAAPATKAVATTPAATAVPEKKAEVQPALNTEKLSPKSPIVRKKTSTKAHKHVPKAAS